MKSSHYNPRHRGANPGFALIITITLMVLLTVIVVALLSLSSVALRTASHGEAAATARNNARLGMLLALGELQASMGPDRRVSATAGSISTSSPRPHLTGVWETPLGGPPELDPGTYYSDKAATFRRWLVSAADPENAEKPGYPSAAPSPNSVELVGEWGTNGPSTMVWAEKIPLAGGKSRGSVAWAAFDESGKAAIHLGDPLVRPETSLEVATRTSPPRFRADIVSDLEALAEPRNLISLETAVIPGGHSTAEDVRRRFHDFTTASSGLLTDPANGGLKTDLTTLFEADPFPAQAFPTPTLYGTAAAGAPQWAYLYDHYNKYQTVRGAEGGSPTYRPASADLQIARGRGLDLGVDPSPERERLIPVIAKLQLVFSIVSHHAHISDRIQFYNTHGDPRGNQNHAVPHLAYDPVVTLYNPYDVALDLTNLRVRVSDPPVGFRFEKIDNKSGTRAWYRQEMASGQYHGLAQFQIANEKNRSARKFFTLILSDGTPARSGNSLRLQPGEVKVFSPRVEENWSWGLETSGGYSVRSFFDWNAGNNFGNIDGRSPRGIGKYGVEAVPGWDTRAGLQTDHMSYGSGRPDNTRYDFERSNNWGGGFISMRLTDEIRVQARPEKMATGGIADFQVEILAGRNEAPDFDVLRSFRFIFQDPVAELSADPDYPVIEQQFLVDDTLQAPNDRTSANKKPFAMLEMAARTTRDELDDSKAWLYNNPVVEGGNAMTARVGLANQSYDVRLVPMQSFNSFPGGIEIDPDTYRGFYGASNTASEGSSNVPMFRVPLAPAASLGDLIPANLVAGSQLPRVLHPLGNSRAHPLIPANAVSRSLGTQMLDHVYLINNALWDSYYFSSITDYDAGMAAVDGRSRKEVLTDVLSGTRPALNTRLIPASSPGDPETLAEELISKSDADLARELAAHLAISGPFNLNSTSVDAWRSALASLRDRAVTAWGNRAVENEERTPFPRMSLPLAGSAEADEEAGFDLAGQVRWAGFRTLDDGRIEDLAEAIVEQIRLRGEADGAPALTLGEFINRRPGTGIHSQAGILQTAIDESGVNTDFHNLDSKRISSGDVTPIRRTGASNLDAMEGWTGEGAPPLLTQGDLMMGLAPIATIRGDTFKIRSYGEATTPNGETVLARAWCEAVVQRIPDFVDPADAPETPEADLQSTVNESFGRRFTLVSFRWLSEDEI